MHGPEGVLYNSGTLHAHGMSSFDGAYVIVLA